MNADYADQILNETTSLAIPPLPNTIRDTPILRRKTK